jgi:hypothetical protein
VTPTRPATLLLLATLGAGLGFGVAEVWTAWTGSIPTIPWAAPITLAFVAAAFLVAEVALKPRLRRDLGARPLDPLVAARTAMLAKAGCAAGAVVTGGYLGFALYLSFDFENPYRRHVFFVALLSALAAALASLGAYLLERACRVKPPTDGPGVGDARSAGTDGQAQPTG